MLSVTLGTVEWGVAAVGVRTTFGFHNGVFRGFPSGISGHCEWPSRRRVGPRGFFEGVAVFDGVVNVGYEIPTCLP